MRTYMPTFCTTFSSLSLIGCLLLSGCTHLNSKHAMVNPHLTVTNPTHSYAQHCNQALTSAHITGLQAVGKAIVTAGYALVSYQASAASITQANASPSGQFCIVNAATGAVEITPIDALRYESTNLP